MEYRILRTETGLGLLSIYGYNILHYCSAVPPVQCIGSNFNSIQSIYFGRTYSSLSSCWFNFYAVYTTTKYWTLKSIKTLFMMENFMFLIKTGRILDNYNYGIKFSILRYFNQLLENWSWNAIIGHFPCKCLSVSFLTALADINENYTIK